MSLEESKTGSISNAIIVVICASAIIVVFTAFRGTDLLNLPELATNLGGGPLFGLEGLRDSAVGIGVSALLGISWFGLGTSVLRFIPWERRVGDSHILELVKNVAAGAIFWSLIWLFLGIFGLYSTTTALFVTVAGIALWRHLVNENCCIGHQIRIGPV